MRVLTPEEMARFDYRFSQRYAVEIARLKREEGGKLKENPVPQQGEIVQEGVNILYYIYGMIYLLGLGSGVGIGLLLGS